MLEVPERVAHEGLGLAAGGAVADGDRGDVPLLHQLGQDRRRGRLAAGRLEVHQPRPEVLPGVVDHRQLAAGAQARIDAEHGLRPERRGEQELADVLGEHVDRGVVGHVAQRLVHLGVDRRGDVRAQGQPRRRLSSGAPANAAPADGQAAASKRAVSSSTSGSVVPSSASRPRASAPAPPPSTRAASPGSGASCWLEQLLDRLLVREVVLEPAGGLGLLALCARGRSRARSRPCAPPGAARRPRRAAR